MIRRITNFLQSIADKAVRETLKNVITEVENSPFRKGDFRFYEYTLTLSGTQPFFHQLGFTPKDVILLSISKPDSATVTFNHDAFTREKIEVTVSAPCTLRFYLGRYEEYGA